MIPSQWPDMEKWAIDYLSPRNPGVKVSNIYTEPAGAFSDVFVTATYGPRVTPITQQVRLDFEVRVRDADGNVRLFAQQELAATIAYQIESAPRDGAPIVFAEKDSGPNRVSDRAGGPEFHELTVVLEVHRN